MTAPSSKYHSNDITFTKSGQSNKVLQMALKSEYSALTDAQIREKFKIDKLRATVKGSDTCFVGAINLNAGVNHKFHNSARVSTVKIGSYTFLNDAGLNRKAEAEVVTVLNTDATSTDQSIQNFPPIPGSVRVFYSIYSPLYNPVTSAVIEMLREGTSSTWDTIHTIGSISADTLSTGYIDNPSGINLTGNHLFRARVTNEEGEYISDTFTVELSLIAEVMTYDNDTASEAESGAERTVYRDTLNIIAYDSGANSDATTFYKLVSGEYVQADAGYYVVEGIWYRYGYEATLDRYCVIATGQCEPGGYPAGDPGNVTYTYNQVDCSGFDRDYIEDARWEVTSGNYDLNTLYLETEVDYNNNTNITYAYVNSSHTTLAGQGFYVVGNMIEGISREIEVDYSGQVVSDVIY